MKNILLPILFFSIAGCCKKTTVIVHYVNEEYKNFVPYKQNDTIVMLYNDTKVVNFVVSVESQFISFDCSDWCCAVRNEFEQINYYLKADYPISDIVLILNENNYLSISAFNSFVSIGYANTNIIDSVVINNQTYKNVYVSKFLNHYDEYIYVDSVYYNVLHGILKIFMSNNKNYTIYE